MQCYSAWILNRVTQKHVGIIVINLLWIHGKSVILCDRGYQFTFYWKNKVYCIQEWSFPKKTGFEKVTTVWKKTNKMGFSSALQGPASHDAILLRIDAELRLLENMRRCVGIRIKSDSKCLQHPGGLSLRNLGKISKKWNNNKCFFIFKWF